MGSEFALLFHREGTTVVLCYVVAVPTFGSATSPWARYVALTVHRETQSPSARPSATCTCSSTTWTTSPACLAVYAPRGQRRLGADRCAGSSPESGCRDGTEQGGADTQSQDRRKDQRPTGLSTWRQAVAQIGHGRIKKTKDDG